MGGSSLGEMRTQRGPERIPCSGVRQGGQAHKGLCYGRLAGGGVPGGSVSKARPASGGKKVPVGRKGLEHILQMSPSPGDGIAKL